MMSIRYEVGIKGPLGPRWIRRFQAMELVVEPESGNATQIVLHGSTLDTAKLQGILNLVWSLNLELDYVRRRQENAPAQPPWDGARLSE